MRTLSIKKHPFEDFEQNTKPVNNEFNATDFVSRVVLATNILPELIY